MANMICSFQVVCTKSGCRRPRHVAGKAWQWCYEVGGPNPMTTEVHPERFAAGVAFAQTYPDLADIADATAHVAAEDARLITGYGEYLATTTDDPPNTMWEWQFEHPWPPGSPPPGAVAPPPPALDE